MAEVAKDHAVQTDGLAQLNKSTLARLEKVLEDNSEADLWLQLRELTRQYKAERERHAEEPKIDLEETASDKRKYPKHLFPTQGQVNIVWPLAPSLTNLLQVCPPSASGGFQEIQTDRVSRSTLLGLIQRGEWISQEFQKVVVQIAPNVVVKISRANGVIELMNIQHIRKVSRSFPVPDALGMLEIQNTFYVFTTFIPGIPLDRIWGDLTFSGKRSIQHQLNTLFTELRNLPLPSEDGFLGAGDPPFCQDMRRWTRKSSGVIKCEAQFNDFLLSEAHVSSAYVDLIRPCFRDDHRIVMMHSDLHPRNILVSNERDLEITGIIDWEAGGGYPEYWEYVKASQTVLTEEPDDWHLFLPDVAIGTYIDEYIRDSIIDRIVY